MSNSNSNSNSGAPEVDTDVSLVASPGAEQKLEQEQKQEQKQQKLEQEENIEEEEEEEEEEEKLKIPPEASSTSSSKVELKLPPEAPQNFQEQEELKVPNNKANNKDGDKAEQQQQQQQQQQEEEEEEEEQLFVEPTSEEGHPSLVHLPLDNDDQLSSISSLTPRSRIVGSLYPSVSDIPTENTCNNAEESDRDLQLSNNVHANVEAEAEIRQSLDSIQRELMEKGCLTGLKTKTKRNMKLDPIADTDTAANTDTDDKDKDQNKDKLRKEDDLKQKAKAIGAAAAMGERKMAPQELHQAEARITAKGVLSLSANQRHLQSQVPGTAVHVPHGDDTIAALEIARNHSTHSNSNNNNHSNKEKSANNSQSHKSASSTSQGEKGQEQTSRSASSSSGIPGAFHEGGTTQDHQSQQQQQQQQQDTNTEEANEIDEDATTIANSITDHDPSESLQGIMDASNSSRHQQQQQHQQLDDSLARASLVIPTPEPAQPIPVAIPNSQDRQHLGATTYQQAKSRHPKRTLLISVLGILIVFIFIVGIILVTMAFTIWSDDDDDDDGINADDSTDLTSQTTAASVRFSSFNTTLEELFGTDYFNNANSVQFKALQWMVYDDPLELDPITEDYNVIQRFVLTYLYFVTGPWTACNPPAPAPAPAQQSINPTETVLCTYQALIGNGKFEVEYQYGPIYAYYVSTVATRWLTEKHECKWAGIFCNDQKQVEEIRLDRLGLRGTVPTELAALTNLKVISMTENALRGSLPTEFGSMSHLQYIALKHNLLQGTPGVWLEMDTPNNFPMLDYLNLQNNSFSRSTIPSNIGRLTKLDYLNLMENLLIGSLPTDLFRLSNLS